MTEKSDMCGYVNRIRHEIDIDGVKTRVLRIKIAGMEPDTLGMMEEDLLDTMIVGGTVPVYRVSYVKQGRKQMPLILEQLGRAAMSTTVKAVVLEMVNGDKFGISFEALNALIDGDRHHCAVARLSPLVPLPGQGKALLTI